MSFISMKVVLLLSSLILVLTFIAYRLDYAALYYHAYLIYFIGKYSSSAVLIEIPLSFLVGYFVYYCFRSLKLSIGVSISILVILVLEYVFPVLGYHAMVWLTHLFSTIIGVV